MPTEYILEVYEPGDRRAHNEYISSTPFSTFSVGDTIKTETQGTARIINIGHIVSKLPGSERITHIAMVYTSIS